MASSVEIVAGVVVLFLVGLWILNRPRRVLVYHIGAVQQRLGQLEGKKFLVYGFVRPVYGTKVRLVGLGGEIRGVSTLLPSEGAVLSGRLVGGVFQVESVIKQAPAAWKLEFVGPAQSMKAV